METKQKSKQAKEHGAKLQAKRLGKLKYLFVNTTLKPVYVKFNVLIAHGISHMFMLILLLKYNIGLYNYI